MADYLAMEEEHDLKTLISFQRQELMAAKTCESDLDFAFNLQLQEAIAASQSLTPSSSSSAAAAAPSPFTVEDSLAAHISDVILQEIEKYEQERRDFEQCKAEMKNLKQNLSIQLHDHNFASEIARISEQNWAKYGDNYEMPYNISYSSSSSSFALAGNESFRVYFKGIVDNDGRNKLGAVGVAICDPRDNLILRGFEADDRCSRHRIERRESRV